MVTRIRELLEARQLSPTQFADLIGVGRPVISHILSERNKPSLEVVQKVISAFPEVSLPWLLSGIGSMLATAPLVAAPPASPAPAQPTFLAPIVSQEAPIPVNPPVAPVPPPPARPLPPRFRPATQASAPLISDNLALQAAAELVAAPMAPTLPAPPAPPAAPVLAPALTAPPAQLAAPAARPPAPIEPLAVAPPAALAAAPAPAATIAAMEAVAPTAAPDGLPTESTVNSAALSFLGEPGKAIRRIVIFYRDGSFSDYVPEG